MSAFILDAEHVRVTRDEEKLGLNSSVTNDIAIDSFVEADRLIGEQDHGFRIAMATLSFERGTAFINTYGNNMSSDLVTLTYQGATVSERVLRSVSA